MLENANRRKKQPDKAQKPPHTQQTQSRRPPDNYKMTDKRSKPTKPTHKARKQRHKKETYHRKTSRQAIKQPEAHANAQNRQKKISPAKRHINGSNIQIKEKGKENIRKNHIIFILFRQIIIIPTTMRAFAITSFTSKKNFTTNYTFLFICFPPLLFCLCSLIVVFFSTLF